MNLCHKKSILVDIYRQSLLKLSNLQATLAKVGNITAKTEDILLKAHSENTPLDIEAMIGMNTDTIALLGHVNFEMVERRRDVIRPNLNKDYATLCASNVPITSMLFVPCKQRLHSRGMSWRAKSSLCRQPFKSVQKSGRIN